MWAHTPSNRAAREYATPSRGGSLFGAEEGTWQRTHGYTVGRFVVEGAKRRAEVWTRQGWRDGHGWKFGPSDELSGRWKLGIELTDRAVVPGALDRPTEVRWAEDLGSVAPVEDLGQWATSPEELDGSNGRSRWLVLSASLPVERAGCQMTEAERKIARSGRPDAVRAFVVALARTLRASDTGLIFGGHPSITALLAPIVMEGQAGEPWLRLVQDDRYWDRFIEEVGVIVHSPEVEGLCLEAPHGVDGLKHLRSVMVGLDGVVGAVFVGGLEGIRQEFEVFGKRHPSLPRLAVGLGGGMAAELLLDRSEATEDGSDETISVVASGAVHGEGAVVPHGRLWHSVDSAVEAVVERFEVKAT